MTTTNTDSLLAGIKRWRRAATIVCVVPLIAVMVFTERQWPAGWPHLAMIIVGFPLVICGAFGRIWASIFISGYKNGKLVTEGPYSMVRNPLYFSSLMAGLGLGLSAGSLTATAIIAILFALYYPLLVREEEIFLSGTFTAEWAAYSKATPAFLPRPGLFNEPETYVIHPKRIRRALGDAVWLPLGILAVQLVDLVHAKQLIPILFTLP